MAATQAGMKRFYAAVRGRGPDRRGSAGVPASETALGEYPGQRHGAGRGYVRLPGLSEGIGRRPGGDHGVRRLPVPFCQTFATLQMPTIEERLIKTGRLRWRYRDFPAAAAPLLAAGGAFRRLCRRAGQILGSAPADLRGPGGLGRRPGCRPLFRNYAKAGGLDL